MLPAQNIYFDTKKFYSKYIIRKIPLKIILSK